VTYLLDTNACIALINGTPARTRERFADAAEAGATIIVSTVTVFELWYGVAKSARRAFNARRVETFLAGSLDVVTVEEEDAQAAGRVRAGLEGKRTPIGPFDVLIAGQALARNATLVTTNTGEFARVPGLTREDWTR
jgi:tRNA(fMet)-specific endonuclease VapC